MPTRRNRPSGRPNQIDTSHNSTTAIQAPSDEVGHWVGRIRPHLESAAESIIAAGREFLAAKDALPHGEFGQVADDLGVDQSTVRRFMAIAANPALNRAHVHGLPSAWSTLYELSRVEPDALKDALERGAVGPTTTRAEAKGLREYHEAGAITFDITEALTELTLLILSYGEQMPPAEIVAAIRTYIEDQNAPVEPWFEVAWDGLAEQMMRIPSLFAESSVQ